MRIPGFFSLNLRPTTTIFGTRNPKNRTPNAKVQAHKAKVDNMVKLRIRIPIDRPAPGQMREPPVFFGGSLVGLVLPAKKGVAVFL